MALKRDPASSCLPPAEILRRKESVESISEITCRETARAIAIGEELIERAQRVGLGRLTFDQVR